MKQVRPLKKIFAGGVVLLQYECPGCDDLTLLPESNPVCDCGHSFKNKKAIREERLSSNFRSKIPTKTRQKIIEKQDGECIYCSRYFGSYIRVKNKVKQLTAHIDHFTPIAYNGSNSEDNLVASCNRCNSYKSSNIFDTIDECRTHLLDKWQRHVSLGVVEDI
jgi:5-methylcytosine-specific restriction endonuclease McrA